MSLHGCEIVDERGQLWRAFAPGWRLWLWLGYLLRRLVLARLPGRLLPFVGWSPGRRIDVRIGARRFRVRVERVEQVGASAFARRVKLAEARLRRVRSEIDHARPIPPHRGGYRSAPISCRRIVVEPQPRSVLIDRIFRTLRFITDRGAR